MPWLADLVQSSEGSLDVLPVQCLCEFLLHDAADDSSPVDDEEEGESKEQRAKKRQVCAFPSETVSEHDHTSVCFVQKQKCNSKPKY